ncbi:MAG: potassium transporter TrkG [Flavobacteriales bacterium]|nr:potassium transporter TrkG [Flavobacteriales bacterium]
MTLNELRERVNVGLHPIRARVLSALKAINVVISLSAFASLIAYYGFPLDSDIAHNLIGIIKLSFGFYVVHFFVKWLFDFHPLEFIRSNKLEAALMGLLIVEGISDLATGQVFLGRAFDPLGIESVEDWTVWLVQAYFLVIVFMELSERARTLPRFRFHPATLFILSFLFLILAGTGLLMLPEMTTDGNGMRFFDALFTSTSATCVTGLMTENTETFFTHKGHVVLMVMIKLGGLNIIAFGSLLSLLARFGVGVRQHDVIEDFVNRGSILGSRGTLGRVILWSIGIEAAGALALFLFWPGGLFEDFGDRLFNSFFLSISAFNNAGISLFSGGLADPRVSQAWLVHWTVTLLVFFGALGMVAIFDLFSRDALRDRMRNPWRQIGFPTKIALYFSLGFVGLGALAYMLLECGPGGTIENMSWTGRITTAFFQSATRTSGFNSVDIGGIGTPMLFLMIVLMFIGASSSSTGGGIKTSTFAVVFADLMGTIRGLQHPHLFRRTIGKTLRSRAWGILMFFLLFNLLGTFALTLSEPHLLQENRGFLNLLFEQVSALGTVGLSTGITSQISPVGRGILIASMIIGRVGTLTVAFAFTRSVVSRNYKYPEGHTMVG